MNIKTDLTKIDPDIPGGWMRGITWQKVDAIRCAVVGITPNLAKQMLLGNTLNRSLRHYSIERYARDMACNRWTLTGSPLIFATDGELLDGQHRLYASIEGGGTFKTLVVCDVETATRLKIDTNIARKHPDMLKLIGEKNVTLLAGMLSHLWRWQHGDIDTRKAVISFSEMQIILDNHTQRVADAVSAIQGPFRQCARWGGPSVHAALFFLFEQVSRNAATQFYELLESGEGLTAKSPIHLLRNLLIRAYSGDRKTRRTPTETMAVVIKTWNAWRTSRELEFLHWRKAEHVPQIEGLPKAWQRTISQVPVEVE